MRAHHRFVQTASQFVSGLCLALLLAPAFAAPAASVPAASPPAVSTPASDGVTIGAASITYLTRSGDTLMSIARQYTDKSSNWAALGKLNRIDKDSAIPVGTPILIPAELLGDLPAKATVVAMTGSIAATNIDGSVVNLRLGATVVEGTRIQTGANSFLTLALADMSRISVPSNTHVQVAILRTARYLNSPRTRILLLRGKVESRVAPLEISRGRFEVRTPLSVAGVRGTNFRVGYVTGPGAGTGRWIATETLEGKVAVAKGTASTSIGSDAGTGAAPDVLVLTAGKGNITDAQLLGPAIDLLPAPRLAPAPLSGRAEFPATRIAVVAVPGARAYHLQIARDPEAVNLLAETRSTSPVIAIDGVPDGQYYARLSAIDRFGLEGLSSIEQIILRPAADAPGDGAALPGAPRVTASDARTVTLRWAASAGEQARLQLARDADFTFLLANRVSATGQAQLARPPFGTYYARIEILDANGRIRARSLAQPFIVTDQWIINDGNPVAVRQSSTNAGQ